MHRGDLRVDARDAALEPAHVQAQVGAQAAVAARSRFFSATSIA
jgi:hypothetical protein